jgi:hypothetical protein
MNKPTKLFLVLFFLIFEGCLTAGTHGSIKSYVYPTTKYKLQKAVETVLAASGNVKRDTAKNYIIDKSKSKGDTINDNYYNDGERYVTINIQTREGYYEYTFQYSGKREYWDTSKNASISIAYAYDKNGNGGSEGNGGINQSLKRKFLKPFESEFISKIDKELNLKHNSPQ